MSTQADHKERIRHLIERIRAGASGVEMGLKYGHIGTEGAIALATAATELAYYLALHDALAPAAPPVKVEVTTEAVRRARVTAKRMQSKP